MAFETSDNQQREYFFENRIKGLEETLRVLEKKLQKLAAFRLVVFIIIVAVLGLLVDQGLLIVLFFVLPLCGLAFGFVVKKFNQMDFRKKQCGNLIRVNQQEIDILNNKLLKYYDGGRFINEKHSYTGDLDIFGKHSVFQLINRATTEAGEEKLAHWLAEAAERTEVLKRQEAIRELSPAVDWRQEFQASGMHYSNTRKAFDKLLKWMRKPNQLLKDKNKYLLLAGFMAIVSSIAIGYFLSTLMSFLRGTGEWSPLSLLYIILILFINGRILKRIGHLTEELMESSQNGEKTLKGYELLIGMIESKDFASSLLNRIKGQLKVGEYAASAEIRRLKLYLEVFQHQNFFYQIFNSFYLLDVYFILLIERWREKNGLSLEKWGAAIGEFETLSGIAAFSFGNHDFSFPDFNEKDYSIKMEGMRHPLISADKRVFNDFELDGQGKIAVITGSNMAGKSTFLRTIGVNLVLAYMGAPCGVKSATVSFLMIFSSMRVHDDIFEGASSFYAELRKIEQLLGLLAAGKPVLFLLDEVFKGTNSKDRYRGGVSLIKQLSGMNSFGIIATHDLELANLAESNMNTLNYSFNSKMSGKEMLFDYKITQGICHDFNASELMKRSGIILIPETE